MHRSVFERRLLHLMWRFLLAVAWLSPWLAAPIRPDFRKCFPHLSKPVLNLDAGWKAVAPSSTQSSVARPADPRLKHPIPARLSLQVDAAASISLARQSLENCLHPPGAGTPAGPLVQYSRSEERRVGTECRS